MSLALIGRVKGSVAAGQGWAESEAAESESAESEAAAWGSAVAWALAAVAWGRAAEWDPAVARAAEWARAVAWVSAAAGQVRRRRRAPSCPGSSSPVRPPRRVPCVGVGRRARHRLARTRDRRGSPRHRPSGRASIASCAASSAGTQASTMPRPAMDPPLRIHDEHRQARRRARRRSVLLRPGVPSYVRARSALGSPPRAWLSHPAAAASDSVRCRIYHAGARPGEAAVGPKVGSRCPSNATAACGSKTPSS